VGDRREVIDVSHTIEDGMITYEDLPAPVTCDCFSHEESRSHDGRDLSELLLDSLADLETIVFRSNRDEGRAIDKDHLEDLGDLANTGWDAHCRTDRYFEGHPFLTREAAEHLRILDRLPDRDRRFFAVPVKVTGLGTFLSRAFEVIQR
jgi:arylformamidase